MSFTMTHLAVAHEIYDRMNLPGNPESFFLGAISPDSVHVRSDYHSAMKKASHFCVGDEAWGQITNNHEWRDNVISLLRARRNAPDFAFHLGYFTHIFVDIIDNEKIHIPFKEKYARQGLPPQDRRRAFYNDKDRNDFALYKYFAWTAEVRTRLTKARGVDVGDVVSAKETEQYRDKILTRYDGESAYNQPNTFLSLDDNLKFIQDTADEIILLLVTQLNLPPNYINPQIYESIKDGGSVTVRGTVTIQERIGRMREKDVTFTVSPDSEPLWRQWKTAMVKEPGVQMMSCFRLPTELVIAEVEKLGFTPAALAKAVGADLKLVEGFLNNPVLPNFFVDPDRKLVDFLTEADTTDTKTFEWQLYTLMDAAKNYPHYTKAEYAQLNRLISLLHQLAHTYFLNETSGDETVRSSIQSLIQAYQLTPAVFSMYAGVSEEVLALFMADPGSLPLEEKLRLAFGVLRLSKTLGID